MFPTFPSSERQRLTKTELLLIVLTVLAGIGFIVAFVAIALKRIAYPFDLDWIEGLMIEHARRVASGMPIYVKPSPDFVPTIYPPLYYYAGAIFIRIFGEGHLALRLLSLLSFLGVLSVIWVIVRGETRNSLAAWVAAFMMAATYGICGTWFDLARNDGLYLLIELASFACIMQEKKPYAQMAGGALLACAYLTKQSCLAVAIPFLALYAVLNWRGALLAGIPFAASAAILTALLYFGTNGWYTFYVFDIPRNLATHPRPGGVMEFWLQGVLTRLPVLCVGTAIGMLAALYHRDRHRLAYIAFWAIEIGTAFMRRSHLGSWNAFIPAYVALVLLSSLCLGDHLVSSREMKGMRGHWARTTAYGLCLAQFLILACSYSAVCSKKWPSARDVEAGRHLEAVLSGLDGNVLALNSPYLVRRAGKPGSAHFAAMSDASLVNEALLLQEVFGPLKERLESGYYAYVVTDNRVGGQLFPGWNIAEHSEKFHNLGEIFGNKSVFWPIVGRNTRPEHLYMYSYEDIVPIPLFENSDFEDGALQRWTPEGDAFKRQPTLGDNSKARGRDSANFQGRYWVGTYEKYSGASGEKTGAVQGDSLSGTLRSPTFSIEDEKILFRIGGANNAKRQYVALEVEGKEVCRSTGLDSEEMREVCWLVPEYTGKNAQIVVVDAPVDKGWGHINVDDFHYLLRRGKTNSGQ